MDEEFFNEAQHTEQPQFQEQLAQVPPSLQEPLQPINADYTEQQVQLNYDAPQLVPEANDPDNDFNQFEEDETARRIRQEEERIQAILKEKSERERQQKQHRREEGRRLLQEFQASKEEERARRKQQNNVKEGEEREQAGKMRSEGWKKVVASINVRQGQSKSDHTRMREAILHKRQDEKR